MTIALHNAQPPDPKNSMVVFRRLRWNIYQAQLSMTLSEATNCFQTRNINQFQKKKQKSFWKMDTPNLCMNLAIFQIGAGKT